MSSSVDDLVERVAELERLLDALVPGWDPDRETNTPFESPPPERVGVACRSALVLLVSYFEGFLKDLVDEGYDALATSGVPSARLPGRIRGHIISQHVSVLRNEADAGRIWEATAAIAALGKQLQSDGPIDPALLPRSQTRREVSSIEPKKINMILRAFGDSDLNRGPISAFSVRLQHLKELRDNAVHGNERDLPLLGVSDVRDARDLVLGCARALDSRMSGLLAILCAPMEVSVAPILTSPALPSKLRNSNRSVVERSLVKSARAIRRQRP